MKSLILNSIEPDSRFYDHIKYILKSYLSKLNYKEKFIDLHKKKIEYCIGCSYCCEREPGICIKKDDMQDIYPEMVNSNLFVFVTTVTFGGINSELKKVIDRISPLFLPTYTLHRGELHHPLRYPGPQTLLSIGILQGNYPAQKKTFKLVMNRLKTAFFVQKSGMSIIQENWKNDQISEKIKMGFNEMGLSV